MSIFVEQIGLKLAGFDKINWMGWVDGMKRERRGGSILKCCSVGEIADIEEFCGIFF